MRFKILLLFLFFTIGCITRTQYVSRPAIMPDEDWKISGCENCYPAADSLVGKDIEIRVEMSNEDDKSNIFLIKAYFQTKDKELFAFDYSKVRVKLSNGEIHAPKGFTCSYGINDLNFYRNPDEYIKTQPQDIQKVMSKRLDITNKGPIPLKTNACFALFFDHKPPLVSEEFIMNFHDSLTKSGQVIDIPELYFRKGKIKYTVGLFSNK